MLAPTFRNHKSRIYLLARQQPIEWNGGGVRSKEQQAAVGVAEIEQPVAHQPAQLTPSRNVRSARRTRPWPRRRFPAASNL